MRPSSWKPQNYRYFHRLQSVWIGSVFWESTSFLIRCVGISSRFSRRTDVKGSFYWPLCSTFRSSNLPKELWLQSSSSVRCFETHLEVCLRSWSKPLLPGCCLEEMLRCLLNLNSPKTLSFSFITEKYGIITAKIDQRSFYSTERGGCLSLCFTPKEQKTGLINPTGTENLLKLKPKASYSRKEFPD